MNLPASYNIKRQHKMRIEDIFTIAAFDFKNKRLGVVIDKFALK